MREVGHSLIGKTQSCRHALDTSVLDGRVGCRRYGSDQPYKRLLSQVLVELLRIADDTSTIDVQEFTMFVSC
jgi:hypothetical protein